jgi:murein DD-endopeptidase MepM/ murein hydrolase activator NlpD
VAIEIITVRRLLVTFIALLVLSIGFPQTVASETPMERANRIAEELNATESLLDDLDVEIRTAQMQADEAQAIIDSLKAQVQATAIQRFINNDQAQYDFTNTDFDLQVRAKALFDIATQDSQEAVEEYSIAFDDLESLEKSLIEFKAEKEVLLLELQAEVDALNAEFKRLADAGYYRAEPVGGMVCPVRGPVAFSDSWGAPRSGGRSHKGVDMMSPTGTPTVAPVSGTVVHKNSGLGGMSWGVTGDNGDYYYGAHLSAYENVGVGHVEQGTVIGYVGQTGNARYTAPHLHFEIHPAGGAAIDPYPYVSRSC